MEEAILKLMAQVTLVAVIAYVVVKLTTPAAVVVNGCSRDDDSGRADRGRRAKGYIWNNTPMMGPRAQTGLAFGTQPLL